MSSKSGTEKRSVGKVCFAMEELMRFGEASHDGNPLYSTGTYARRTRFGDRADLYVLGGFVCPPRTQDRNNLYLSSIILEFPRPVSVGIDYTVENDLLTQLGIFKDKIALVIGAGRGLGSTDNSSPCLFE